MQSQKKNDNDQEAEVDEQAINGTSSKASKGWSEMRKK